ncbi:MAG: class I SAM-dependent methyltransferase, partial [Moorea sp. SIO3C2]|nr:class I SAM-dependent methyltransferase [Moorena sp. SIO3C2]
MSIFGKTIIHMVSYFLGIDSADTQVTVAEGECLKAFAQGKQNLVEIGVYEGATTRLLADQLDNEAKLYAVDPFIPGRLGICWGRIVAKLEINKSPHARQVNLIEKYSHEALVDIPNAPDFIFIDGDHSLEGIMRDWADLAGLVSSGGIIALHDTRIPNHNPNVANLGSYQYFESYIRHDNRYDLIH